MNIVFRTKKTREDFELREGDPGNKYGDQIGKAVMMRMVFLAHAGNLSKVPFHPPFRCHELGEGKRAGEFAVDLKHPFRLVFTPAHDPVPRKADGGIDLSLVTGIMIESIEDYH